MDNNHAKYTHNPSPPPSTIPIPPCLLDLDDELHGKPQDVGSLLVAVVVQPLAVHEERRRARGLGCYRDEQCTIIRRLIWLLQELYAVRAVARFFNGHQRCFPSLFQSAQRL